MDLDITTDAPGADLRRRVAAAFVGSRPSRWAPGSLAWAELVAPAALRAEALAFYGELLGWSFAHLPMDGYRGYALACTAEEPSPETQVAGIDTRPDRGEPTPRWQPLFACDDVDAAASAAEAFGGTIVVAPHVALGGGRRAVLADPGGAVFGVWQLGGHTGPGQFDSAGAVSWAERRGRGAAAAGTFCERILGIRYEALPATDPSAYGVAVLPPAKVSASVELGALSASTRATGSVGTTGAAWASLRQAPARVDPLVRHGVEPVPTSLLSREGVAAAHDAPSDLAHHGISSFDAADPRWIAYLGIADVRSAVRRAAALGATVVREPWSSAFGVAAHLRDPSGAEFGLIQRG